MHLFACLRPPSPYSLQSTFRSLILETQRGDAGGVCGAVEAGVRPAPGGEARTGNSGGRVAGAARPTFLSPWIQVNLGSYVHASCVAQHYA